MKPIERPTIVRTTVATALAALTLVVGGLTLAQEETGTSNALGGQSLESAANDATASMWTFQLAWEGRTWKDEEGPNGQARPEGNRDMWQLRAVAPIALTKNLTLLNRLTMRNNEAADKSSGAGDAEYFAMFIPLEWATGRWGIGPQVNFPAEDPKFGNQAWRYGFATGLLQRAAEDKILAGVLIQQIWGKTDPGDPDRQVAQPITIQPIFNYSLDKGLYLNIGETALSYNWDAKAWLIPLGIRFGKIFINKNGSAWNLYGEFRTTVWYDDSWPGSVMNNAFRLNVSHAFPM